eukprot:Gb_13471 [translate_table: standard]
MGGVKKTRTYIKLVLRPVVPYQFIRGLVAIICHSKIFQRRSFAPPQRPSNNFLLPQARHKAHVSWNLGAMFLLLDLCSILCVPSPAHVRLLPTNDAKFRFLTANARPHCVFFHKTTAPDESSSSHKSMLDSFAAHCLPSTTFVLCAIFFWF